MNEPKYKYHCDLSPLKGAYCPYCTNDGPLCEFDECDIEVAHESGDEEKVKEIHERILFDQKLKDYYNSSLAFSGVVLPVEERCAYSSPQMTDKEKKILEQKLKEASDRVYKETGVVRSPIDYIGIGDGTKGMNLTEAFNKALKDMGVDLDSLRKTYESEENKDE